MSKGIGPMLRLVLAAGAALSPLTGPVLNHRLKRGKEDPARVQEKRGEASAERPDGPLVWLHGVGVGEVMALRGLIERLSVERDDLNFLLTSSARSSAQVIDANLPPRTIHQYLPLDFPGPVARSLDHWRPDLVVWSDQEVWPRLAVTCARRGIPQAYVAARITDESAKARGRFGHAYGDLYGLMDVIHAQDDRTAANLAGLMGSDSAVTVSGSLKAAAHPLSCDPQDLADLQTATKGRRIWCLASSHPGDEALAIEAHEALRKTDPAALLIIVPRTPSDADHIARAMGEHGLFVQRRSLAPLPDTATPYVIADTFGELGLWYRLAETALIGGTFSEVEGHNPWEAVALDCAVLHGPRTANFAQDFRVLSDANAARPVETAADILAALTDADRDAMTERATAVQFRASEGLDQIVRDLLGLVDR